MVDIEYWLNLDSFEEAKRRVIAGDFKETTEFHLKILEKLNIKDTDTVLDFGCGIGRLTNPISKKCKTIIGVDISDSMITHAINYCKADNIYFKILKDSNGNGMRENYADKAFSIIVLQHISKPKAFMCLMNIHKALKMGGQMLIQFPNLEKCREMYQDYLSHKEVFEGLRPRMEFYTRIELEFIFDIFQGVYTIFEDGSDLYVLLTKKAEIDRQDFYIKSNE